METDRLLVNKDYRFSAALYARAVGCVSSMAEGYDIGCLGTIVADVRKDFDLSPRDVGMLASLPHCFFGIAALGGGLLADKVGRKAAILVTCLALFLGTCLQVIAPALWYLIIGRAVVNLGAGSGVVVVATYLTEVTPARHRGLFVSLEELCFNFGLLMAYLANWSLTGHPHDWRIVIGLGAIGPVIALLLCLLPQVLESPRYLFLCGRKQEAERVLRALVREPQEIREVLDAWETETSQSPRVAIESAPRAVMASVGLAICASLAGVQAVNPLLSYVLVVAGGAGGEVASWSLAIMLVKFLVIVPVCFCLIDRWGRRPLLVVSSLCMAAGCAVAAAALADHLPAVLAMAGIATHLVCYSLGVGPVMWTYCTEVLPTSARAPGMGLAMLASRTFSVVQLFWLPSVMDACPWAPYLFYGITNLGTVVFVAYACPETKHASLESLRGLFKE
uniref:Hexose transporter 1 n=1 Tax=Alexandrium catenella TaxID=2925 RepID=A0A7S1W3J2_ALECA|mmetsp:Transcript_37566/g.101664  ORF Transcript_37566/g.101664 Transcript_37566/m.101664 type:complete len:449 (+) Transcript_37566:66-1412(+)